MHTLDCAKNGSHPVVDEHFLGCGHVCDEPSLSIIVINGRPRAVSASLNTVEGRNS